jgi:hypothetical protein
LQIAPVAWNFPVRATYRIAFSQAKTRQNCVCGCRLDVNADELIEPLVAQRDIWWVRRQLARNRNSGGRLCAGYFTN